MEQTLKKLSWYFFITMIVAILILLALLFKGGGGNLGGAMPNQLWQRSDVLGTVDSPYAFASTTNMAFSQSATTTLVIDYGFDNLSLDIKLINASTSKASSFTITPYFSNDNSCSSAGNAHTTEVYANSGAATSTVSWFTPADLDTNYMNMGQGATTTTAAANRVVFKKYTMRNLTAKCIRFVFSDTNASSTAWVLALLK